MEPIGWGRGRSQVGEIVKRKGATLTLVVGLVTVLHAEVEVLDVKVDIGENQLTDR